MNLKIYKSGQGYNTRMWSGVAAFTILAAGCFVLYRELAVAENIWIQALVPVALCAVGGGILYWMMNLPKVADFMIASEGEIKKVSWSSRSELVASTTIVLVVVVVLSLLIMFTDYIFGLLFTQLFKLY
ncbi:MAG: preprotein translocase subunit SecE [Phycisphaerae bacterium]|nr:preprotein translocase subunit SecE [Phycisphaerae bacterium]